MSSKFMSSRYMFDLSDPRVKWMGILPTLGWNGGASVWPSNPFETFTPVWLSGPLNPTKTQIRVSPNTLLVLTGNFWVRQLTFTDELLLLLCIIHPRFTRIYLCRRPEASIICMYYYQHLVKLSSLLNNHICHRNVMFYLSYMQW